MRPIRRTIRRALEGISRVAWWPVFKFRARRLRRRTAPPKGLESRERSLTLPLPPTVYVKGQRTHPQTQSALLAKLPLEIRQMIWKECVGNMMLHLKIQDRHLRGVVCRTNDVPELCLHFFGLSPNTNVRDVPRRKLLSLLLTCRQVYSEAIDYLYSSNDFDSLFPEVVLYLPRIILPQRFEVIRSLHFLWYLEDPPLRMGPDNVHLHIRNDKLAWLTTWGNISKMKGLRELGVQLFIDGIFHHWWTSKEIELLEPLKAITAPQKFKLYLPFPTMATESALAEFPCTIVRIGDNAIAPL